MALTTAPLMSLDASGTVAKTLVYSKWKGRNYVRQHVIPANPQSALQVASRASLAFLSQAWKALGSTPQSSWKTLADTMKFSEFNAYLATNQKAFANFDPPYQATPPARVSTPGALTGLTATVDNKLVTITGTIALNVNTWGLLVCLDKSVIAACVRGLVVKMVAMPGTTASLVLGPLLPGTYHFNGRTFGTDGVWGGDNGDATFTVT